MEEEIWKDIEEFEGYYQVSNMGRIKSVERFYYCSRNKSNSLFKERIKIGSFDKDGYLSYGLSKGGKVKRFRGHRIVAFAFIPNPENKPQVNHKNGIKTDNRVDNLEWVTASENEIHAHDLGLKKMRRKWLVFYGLECLTSKKVSQFTKDGILIRSYPSCKEAEKQTGFTDSGISACARGEIKTFHKYIWKYDI